jgi:microcystin degradation protein MlrC
MKRIAVAGFSHETNTFSPIPTTYEDFATKTGPFTGIVRWDEVKELKGQRLNDASLGFINTAESLGYETVFILSTSTNPSNQVSKDAFDQIVGMIIDGIREKGRFDAVYLDLHGAMVYEDFNDGETEIVRRIKDALDGIPVFTSYDLHGNITLECFQMATAMVGCREYPHIDMYETGERVARLADHYFQGEPLFKAFRRIPFIPVLSRTSTFTEPFKSIYASIDEVEKNSEVLSGTIMEGFPPSDTYHTGPTVFAYARTQAAADWAVEQMYSTFMAKESEVTSELPGPEEAVRMAIDLSQKEDKPVILADGLDNPGGGSASDSVWILEELVKQDAPDTALGFIYDVDTANKAHEAGEGALITINLGGKLTPGHTPFHGTFNVERLYDGVLEGHGPLVKGVKMSLGKIALLRTGNVRIVVVSERVQAADSAPFRALGLNPEAMQILVLKSSNHFRADFEPIASAIFYVSAPSAMIEDPAEVNYTNLMEDIRLGGNGPPFHKAEA